MSNKKRTGYDQTTNLPMSCSVAAAAGFIYDWMGTLEHDVRPIIDTLIEPGIKFAPFQSLSAEDVENAFEETCLVGEGRLGMTTTASRYPSTGKSSSREQHSKHTRNKPRR